MRRCVSGNARRLYGRRRTRHRIPVPARGLRWWTIRVLDRRRHQRRWLFHQSWAKRRDNRLKRRNGFYFVDFMLNRLRPIRVIWISVGSRVDGKLGIALCGGVDVLARKPERAQVVCLVILWRQIERTLVALTPRIDDTAIPRGSTLRYGQQACATGSDLRVVVVCTNVFDKPLIDTRSCKAIAARVHIATRYSTASRLSR